MRRPFTSIHQEEPGFDDYQARRVPDGAQSDLKDGGLYAHMNQPPTCLDRRCLLGVAYKPSA